MQDNNEKLKKQFNDMLQAMSIDMTLEQQEQVLSYIFLLKKWNSTYNLTAIRSLDEMLTHHLIDSLAIAPYIQGNNIVDVGTGAGFPGVPLAVYFPDKRFTLVDSRGKKIRFIRQACSQLDIHNVTLFDQRVETLSIEPAFDVIMARAVSSLGNVVSLCRHLLSPGGRFILQKGEYPEKELSELQLPYQVIELNVPILSAKRHIVVIENGVVND